MFCYLQCRFLHRPIGRFQQACYLNLTAVPSFTNAAINKHVIYDLNVYKGSFICNGVRKLDEAGYNCSNLFEKNVNVSKRFYSTSSVIEEPTMKKDIAKKPSIYREKFFGVPKNSLHNAFDIISQELNNKDLKVKPHYTINKATNTAVTWKCTYNLKWPEPMVFDAIAQTKQEASHKAAQAALLWLKKNEKISNDAQPIIFSQNDVQAHLSKEKHFVLKLNSNAVGHLQKIENIYKTQFLPILESSIENKKNILGINNLDLGEESMSGDSQKKLFRSSVYYSKEKVHLPIAKYKEEFMDLLRKNNVIIIKGEPGCGKSTRIPQYILESWAREGLGNEEPCQIAVTQPRRIAAVSLANRVSSERDEMCGHVFGYQIRLKSVYNPRTGRVLYCTTGILLKYLQSDINLLNFTHVILDEAHERDVNTDLLLNLLRGALQTNPKLKLIVMSATIDVDLFRKYLNDPPVMHIAGFTYPVNSYFLDDVKHLNLNKSLEMSSNNNQILGVPHEDVVKLIKYIHRNKKEGAILCFLPGWEDISKVEKLIPKSNDLSVLCLHSRLQDSDQQKIFFRPPPGVRKVILSTNIAETSVTIDDVVYVIDTGICKENRFDSEKGVTCIDNFWISQSSMNQRKGRAGRVGPGESFHLYTKEKYEQFSKFTDPEILKTSLTKIVLNSKAYSNNMDAIEFMDELPTPPEKNSTRRAVHDLKDLKLLDDNENLTSLGKTLANFQLEPKLAKSLVNSVVYKCVTPVLDIITIFSADTELFTGSLLDKEGIKRVKIQGSKHSDHLAMMRLFEAWLELMEDTDQRTAERYCADAKMVPHKLFLIQKLRKIHFDYLHNGLHDTLPISDVYSDNDELVRAVLVSGAGHLLIHRNWDIVKGRYKQKNTFLTKYNQRATITSDSVNFKHTTFSSPFLIYFNEVQSNIRRTTLIRETSVIAPITVLLFSDKDLIIQDQDDQNVIISLKGTKLQLVCTKTEAQQIANCKESLSAMYEYLIFQMTAGGERNSRINAVWDRVLQEINSLLTKHSIK